MSFPRAPLKRFNEHVGCAPPPGTYEVKNEDVKGAASFRKAERFKLLKSAAGQPSPGKDVFSSPMRRTISADGLAEVSSLKKDRTVISMNTKLQKLLEKEIRSLVQQRAEQDSRLQVLEEELRKVEAKLLSAVREKTGLNANVASLERQLVELKKINEFLKTKVSSDSTKKRINTLSLELIEAKNKLDAKDKELSYLHINTEGQVKVLETDLEALRSTLEALRERNGDLEELRQETKVQNEELEAEMDKLHAVIQELREEIKALQGYLDTANDEIQDLRSKMREKEKAGLCASESLAQLGELEKLLEQRSQELQTSQNTLGEKEQELERRARELQDSQEAAGETETQLQRSAQELRDSQSALLQQEKEMGRLREVLRRTEEELDQRVAQLGERCLALEQERDRTQEEGLRRVQEVNAEISLLEEKRKSDSEAQRQLEDSCTALAEQLEEEKVRSSSLVSLLERLQGELEAEQRQLEAELEEVLSVLEAQEQRGEEAIQRLQQENQELQMELKDTKTDLDSTKISLGDEVRRGEARRLELEEEVMNLKKKIEENHLQRLDFQQSQDKVKEEYARMLLDAQTRLARKETELRRAVEAHASEAEQLQGRAQRESEGRHELEAQLERERRGEQEERAAETMLRSRAEQMEQEMLDLRRRMEEERVEMQRRLAEVEKSVPAVDEAVVWRERYEELYAKVKPFQEQLDNFAVERDTLLNENGATQEELNRLADAYARLLGHQNQKQKIKHVVKLKEENIALKQEVAKLKAQLGKQRKDLDQPKSRGPARFDPRKSSKLDSKENQQPLAALEQANKKAI
ncbi:hypothetical protein AAFF_G00309900 [Aldrovandia affinis]|uniref:Hyaluronan-mediated motility receptor C-terminal domain-containing protein n=1 Tax=Aldrovandia affinis TaxID=143900 RepID=A0AAD7SQ66_9TELE|nr:hypothetical protein AAFF_G00309900 [Aldrovandia affinis]